MKTNFRTTRTVVLFVGFCVGFVDMSFVTDGDWSVWKKVVAAGWDLDSVTLEEILSKAEEFDRTGLDGICHAFESIRCDDGEIRNLRWGLMSSSGFSRRTVARYVPVMREIVKHPGLAHSFPGGDITPVLVPRLRWDDDIADRRALGPAQVLPPPCLLGEAVRERKAP